MVSGITPCARECKWIVYFGETPKDAALVVPTGLVKRVGDRSVILHWDPLVDSHLLTD